MKYMDFLLSYNVTVKFTGGDIDRFLNLCKNNGIHLTNLKSAGSGYTANIKHNQLHLLNLFAEKCQLDVKIIKEYGIIPFCRKYKKRVIFFLFMFCFACVLILSSRYIWHIDVEGETIYTKEEIVSYVQEHLVPLGTKRTEINIENLEKDLRNYYDEIAWITCELDGTRLIVRLTETVSKNEIKKSKEPCNIVAVKDGLVTELIATSGKKLVSPGDEVKKGDILITGVVNIYNEYDELIETSYVPADGIVYGETQYRYVHEFPMEYHEKIIKKKKKTGIKIRLGNGIKSVVSPKHTEQMEMMEHVYDLHIGDSYYLPVSLIVNQYYQIEYRNKTYTEEEAREKQEKILQEYIEGLKKKGVEILENNVTIEVVNDECKASGTLLVKEVIGVPKMFDIHEQIQNNEKNEDN